MDSSDIVYVVGDADDENNGHVGNERDKRKKGDYTGDDGFNGGYKYVREYEYTKDDR